MKKLVLLLLFGYLAASQVCYLAAASQTMESTIPPRIVRGIIKIDKSEPRQEGPGWRAAFRQSEHHIELTFNPAFESPPVFVATPSGADSRITVYAVSKNSVQMIFIGPWQMGRRGEPFPWQWELLQKSPRAWKSGNLLGKRINFIAIDSK